MEKTHGLDLNTPKFPRHAIYIAVTIMTRGIILEFEDGFVVDYVVIPPSVCWDVTALEKMLSTTAEVMTTAEDNGLAPIADNKENEDDEGWGRSDY